MYTKMSITFDAHFGADMEMLVIIWIIKERGHWHLLKLVKFSFDHDFYKVILPAASSTLIVMVINPFWQHQVFYKVQYMGHYIGRLKQLSWSEKPVVGQYGEENINDSD